MELIFCIAVGVALAPFVGIFLYIAAGLFLGLVAGILNR